MDELLIGTLLPGAVQIQEENINPVWRGNVTLGEYRRQMYVKAVEPRTLAVEVLCSLVGRAVGLPIPRPALVNVTHRALREVTTPAVFFGCESVDNPDLKKWLRRDTEETARQLSRWTHLIDAGCFDEWTGNPDRHGGNLLYGGGNNFTLIDHSEAIPRGLLVANPARANLLLQFAAADKNRAQITDLYERAKVRSEPFSSVSVAGEAQAILATLTGRETVAELIAFLHQRIHSLLLLISARIGHAQQPLVLQK